MNFNSPKKDLLEVPNDLDLTEEEISHADLKIQNEMVELARETSRNQQRRNVERRKTSLMTATSPMSSTQNLNFLPK